MTAQTMLVPREQRAEQEAAVTACITAEHQQQLLSPLPRLRLAPSNKGMLPPQKGTENHRGSTVSWLIWFSASQHRQKTDSSGKIPIATLSPLGSSRPRLLSNQCYDGAYTGPGSGGTDPPQVSNRKEPLTAALSPTMSKDLNPLE